jgi:hypothetical protein
MNHNVVNLLLILLAPTIAIGLDSGTQSLREYASATFNFRPALLTVAGLVLLFCALIIIILRSAFITHVPSRWLLLTYAAIGLVGLTMGPTTLSSWLPGSLRPIGRLLFPIIPTSFLGFTYSFFILIGVIGLVLNSKKESNKRK